MPTLPISFMSIVLLVGCASPVEQAETAQRNVDRMMTVYGPACTRLGFTANSDQWRNCVLQLAENAEADRYAYAPYYRPYYRGPYWMN